MTQPALTRAIQREAELGGNLRIGLTPCVSANLIVRPLAEIARLMPGLRVDVVEHPADRLAEMLLDGEVNAAIAGRATAPSDRINY